MPTILAETKYTIKCNNCGKFISRKDIEENKAKFHFIPDSVCGPEESYWEHKQCQKK